ncbi:hypothetical protein [Clostridium sp.]|uniref:hypothetical protein n=1 Tax=Clostridium sp. TaxID=1506 RepID=UPI0032169920
MNKKFFKILLTIVILMIIVSIGSLTLLRYYAPSKDGIVYTENLDRKNLDLVISDYINNNYFNPDYLSSKESHEVHKIYGIDEKFGLKYVYMYTLFGKYETINNEKKNVSGGSNPLVIILKQDENGIYSVVNHKDPWDGEAYPTSLKVIFPNKYRVNINQTEISEELNEKMDSQLM